MIKLERILVPIDFSEPSKKALEYALALAEVFGSEVVLLHVIPPVAYAYETGMMSANIAELEEATRKNCEKNIRELEQNVVAGGVSCRTSVVEGVPFVEIVRTARDESATLIVIATHGYTGLKHVLLGSTAEKVVRKATCPVMVVKQAEQEFVMP